LRKAHNTGLEGKTVLVLGGTGPVGTAAAVLASGAGAKVLVGSHSSAMRARVASEVVNTRYGSSVEPVEAGSNEQKMGLLPQANVIFCTAKAGIQVLSKEQLKKASSLLVAADVNAVPPAGIEGLGVMDDGTPLEAGSGKAVGIGALAIGNVKYLCQRGLFQRMINTEKPVYLDFRDAFATARELVA
jgi:methylene-tetrahydromethanopterin dehydrogenase